MMGLRVARIVSLHELGRVLAPGGTAFIHHSNLGQYLDASGTPIVENPHRRASTMTAFLCRQFSTSAGLACISQELINWGNDKGVLSDCISVVAKAPEVETQVVESHGFMYEALRLEKVAQLYKTR